MPKAKRSRKKDKEEEEQGDEEQDEEEAQPQTKRTNRTNQRRNGHRTLSKWLRDPNFEAMRAATQQRGKKMEEVDEMVEQMRQATIDFFQDEEGPEAESLDLFLGFLSVMPETPLGANPFFFSRSKEEREMPDDVEDPTHVTTHVRLIQACALACFPKQTAKIIDVAPFDRWLTLVGFRAIGKTAGSRRTIGEISPTLPLMNASILLDMRRELYATDLKRTTPATNSWCYGLWKPFHSWRRLALHLRLDELFPRAEMYDRVWRTTAPEVLRFAVARPTNFELRRPTFFGMPCFSAEGCPSGPLSRLFYRGCTGKDLPRVYVHVAGMEYCLWPAELMADHVGVAPTVVLQRLCLFYPSVEEKWVARHPPEPMIDYDAQLATNPDILSKFHPTRYDQSRHQGSDDDESSAEPPSLSSSELESTPPPDLEDD